MREILSMMEECIAEAKAHPSSTEAFMISDRSIVRGVVNGEICSYVGFSIYNPTDPPVADDTALSWEAWNAKVDALLEECHTEARKRVTG